MPIPWSGAVVPSPVPSRSQSHHSDPVVMVPSSRSRRNGFVNSIRRLCSVVSITSSRPRRLVPVVSVPSSRSRHRDPVVSAPSSRHVVSVPSSRFRRLGPIHLRPSFRRLGPVVLVHSSRSWFPSSRSRPGAVVPVPPSRCHRPLPSSQSRCLSLVVLIPLSQSRRPGPVVSSGRLGPVISYPSSRFRTP